MVLTKEMLDSYLDSNRISINTEKYKKILYELVPLTLRLLFPLYLLNYCHNGSLTIFGTCC